MKLIMSLFLLGSVFFVQAYGQDEKTKKEDEKIYTQKELDEAVRKEDEKRVLDKLKRFHPDNIVNLSKEFMNKERALELRELEIQKKVESLKVSEADLAKKIKEFKGRSDKLLGCLDEHDRNQNKRVNHMVDVVSGMRPQNAADVLSVQDVDIAVRILGSLAPEKVSKIFNSMDKEISARLQKQFMNMKK
jgi:flagellar motility protein MotE (MotC chaperone)